MRRKNAKNGGKKNCPTCLEENNREFCNLKRHILRKNEILFLLMILKYFSFYQENIRLMTAFIVLLLILVISVQFSWVQSLSCPTLRPHEPQHARPPCPLPTPGVQPSPCSLIRWCHPTISSSVVPSPPALNLPQHQGLFQSVSSSHQVVKVFSYFSTH